MANPKVKELFREVDFKKEMEADPELTPLLMHEAAKLILDEEEDAFKRVIRPISDEQLQNHLIVTGLPLVKSADQQEKLSTALKELITQKKKVPGLVECDIDFNGEVGNGTAYLVFETVKQAKMASSKINRLKFSKNSPQPLSCFTVKDVQEVLNFNSDYTEPILLSTADKIAYNMEQNGLDQFIYRETRKGQSEEGSKIALKWFDNLEKTALSALKNDQEFIFTKKAVIRSFFSVRGTYLVTCHEDGFYLYFGEEIIPKAFFKQKGVQDVKFSPDQKFMVSYNGDQTHALSKQNLIIWAVDEEIKLKVFRASSDQNLDSINFSKDSKKISIALPNEVHFYSLESTEEFKKQLQLPEEQRELTNMVKAPFVQKAVWLTDSATLIILCYDTNFEPNSVTQTRCFLYNTVNQEQRKWKSIGHHVKKGDVIVSDKGDWAAICVKKYVKKNTYSTLVQIANMQKKDKDLEVQHIEFQQKVGNVAWDTARGKFAIMVQDMKNSIVAKFAATFYDIQSDRTRRQQKVIKIGAIPQTLCNRVYISENGTMFALYNIDEKSSERGKFTFGVFTKDQKDKRKTHLEIIKSNISVAYMTFFKVDISGRFVLLGTERGYQIWNTVGQLIIKDSFTNPISDVEWRPRFKVTLSEKEEAKLIQNWKQIKTKHEEIDDKRMNKHKHKLLEQREKKTKEFALYLNKKKQWYRENGFDKIREKMLGFNEKTAKTGKYQVIEKTDFFDQ